VAGIVEVCRDLSAFLFDPSQDAQAISISHAHACGESVHAVTGPQSVEDLGLPRRAKGAKQGGHPRELLALFGSDPHPPIYDTLAPRRLGKAVQRAHPPAWLASLWSAIQELEESRTNPGFQVDRKVRTQHAIHYFIADIIHRLLRHPPTAGSGVQPREQTHSVTKQGKISDGTRIARGGMMNSIMGGHGTLTLSSMWHRGCATTIGIITT